MRFKRFAVKASCVCLAVCMLTQTGFVSLAAENDSAVAGISTALTGYMKNDEETTSTKSNTNSQFRMGFSLNSGISAFAKEEESDVSLYENLAISKVTDYVNIRSEASAESEVLGKIYDQCAATILETVDQEDGTWYKIKSGSVTGYIKADYFVTGFDAEEYAKKNAHMYTRATAGGLRVRESAAMDAEVVAKLYEGETCTVLEDGQEFVKVRTEDGKVGYVYGEYVEIFIKCDEAISIEEERAMIEEQRRLEEEARRKREEEERRKREEEERKQQQQNNSNNNNNNNNSSSNTQKPAQKPTVNIEDVSAARQTVVNWALSKVGCDYVWGAEGPNAYDCSGLVKMAYAQVGVYLAHYSGSQGNAGTRVSLSEVQPGDILWRNGHVGIYIGNGQYVHASTYGVGVIVSNLSSSGFVCGRNVLG